MPPSGGEAAKTSGALVGRAHVSVNGVAHWILFFLKPFYDPTTFRDGLVVTFRVIDDEVAIENQVEDARRLQAKGRRPVAQDVGQQRCRDVRVRMSRVASTW